MKQLFLSFLIICASSIGLSVQASDVSFSKVAVMVYGQNKLSNKYARIAFTRIENILLDNGIEVLDQQQIKELKNVWKQLEDPGYFVTAETFLENTEKYALDGVVRLYLTADSINSWGNSFSATAISDIRFVDSAAQVNAFTSIPMGVPGKPPSDGLTLSAAIANAVQRSVDESAAKLGLEIIDYAKPRTMKFTLSELESAPLDYESLRIKNPDQSFAAYASKPSKRTRHESHSCFATDPSNVLGVVGGYLKVTGFGKRRFSSRLHVVDIADQKEILLFETSLKDRKHSWEKGVRELQDCMFVNNWRYLIGLTGNHISLWDTERGINMSEIHIKKGIKSGGQLDFISDGINQYVKVSRKGRPLKYFEITR